MDQAARKIAGFNDRQAAPMMRRVLLAEDNGELRELLQRALELDGYEVIGFADGTTLVDYLGDALRAQSDTIVPDIIVSDIRMPGFSGMDVLAALRRADLEVPVILITAFGNEEIEAEARRLGASLFIKPFDLDDLRTALKYFLEHERGGTRLDAGLQVRSRRGTPPTLKH